MSGEVKTNLVKNHARFGKPVDNGGLNEHFRRKPINCIFWAWSCLTNDGIVAKKPQKPKQKTAKLSPGLQCLLRRMLTIGLHDSLWK